MLWIFSQACYTLSNGLLFKNFQSHVASDQSFNMKFLTSDFFHLTLHTQSFDSTKLCLGTEWYEFRHLYVTLWQWECIKMIIRNVTGERRLWWVTKKKPRWAWSSTEKYFLSYYCLNCCASLPTNKMLQICEKAGLCFTPLYIEQEGVEGRDVPYGDADLVN